MHRSILALTGLALALATAGPAVAFNDPFVVCVTEPCGPQLPQPPLPGLPPTECVGLPCDVINAVCWTVFGAWCVG